MKRVAIATLGCKTNQFESASMSEMYRQAGYSTVPFSEPADIYVINSCTVTARTDAETRKLARRAKRLNPEAHIIATGCYAQVSPGELEQMPEIDLVLGNAEKREIVLHSGHKGRIVATTDAASSPVALEPEIFTERTRAFIQIQNGCDSFCSYCIVPFARGGSRSVPPERLMSGITGLAKSGFREIVLTGIHIGAYGEDLTPESSLPDLLATLVSSGNFQRIRLGSVEPDEMDARLLDLIIRSPEICRHLHLPLQSGSNSVLERMGRKYTADYFRDLVRHIHAEMPEAFIGADIIAGFPGESEREFSDTVELLLELPVAGLHVFPYSKRPGTKAASMEGHIPPAVIKERAAVLRRLAEEKRLSFVSSSLGKTLQVLVQGYDSRNGMCSGLSRNYLEVSFPGNGTMINREVTVTATEITDGRVSGRPA